MTTSGMRIVLGICLLLLTMEGWGQSTISGTLTSSVDTSPIPYATVYISGTSNGTISDADGVFKLNKVYPPAELVVSHLSYEPMAINITSFGDDSLSLVLEPKKISISQVEVDASDNRAANISRFKNGFIGYDYWGDEAVLLNDSVLAFRKEYEIQEKAEQDTNTIKAPREKLFEVSAQAPLLIDLPRLGYTLYVDLSFYREIPGHTSALGYHYYKPYDLSRRRKKKKIEKNREKAYYNSVQHFCRALFVDSLKQNGYALLEYDVVESEGIARYTQKELTIDSCLVRLSDREMAIKNLSGRDFFIRYRYDLKGKPAKKKTVFNEGNISTSFLYIKGDSCTFTKDGIIPGNGILFGGAMSRKRTGAALPRYYKVKE